MQWTPPLNPKRYHLEELLAARGVSLEWLNSGDSDPYTPANIARYSIVEAAKLIPAHYRAASVDSPEIRAWLLELVTSARTDQAERNAPVASVFEGRSLLLLGPTGTGKTHQAYGAVRALLTRGVRLRWEATTSADLHARLRPRAGHDAERDLQTLARCPLLLLDDLGAAKTSEWTEELTYRLINHRYEHMLPTLITTNLPTAELRTALGDRVASRLAEMCRGGVLLLHGDDRRKGGVAA